MKKRILCLPVLISCGAPPRASGELPRSIDKIKDPDTGVVCYAYYQHAISCVKVDKK